MTFLPDLPVVTLPHPDQSEALIKTFEHESAYVDALMKRTGLGKYVIPEATHETFRERHKDTFKKKIAAMPGLPAYARLAS